MKTQMLKRGTAKVIQLSDTHLFANDELEIFGVKSNIKFKEVIDKFIDEDSINTDMILLTGDISQDETKQSYRKAVDSLTKLNIPIYWIPGNHDNITQIESAFKTAKNFARIQNLSLFNWKLIFLNTKIDGTDEGCLSKSELAMLKTELLKSSNSKKIAIVMHHHPAEVGTPLIDDYILRNKHEFWDAIAGTKVNLIICGHVHGDYKFRHNDITIESTPATCFQWQQGTKDLKIDHRIGYKIYHFTKDDYSAIAKIW